MLIRLFRIFQRHADETLQLEAPPTRIEGVARIDSIRIARNRIRIEGWTPHDRIGLRLARATAWTSPDLGAPGSDLCAFSLDLPFAPGDPELLILRDGTEMRFALRGFSASRLCIARAALIPRYLWILIRLLPQIHRWKRGGDLGAREVIKERLGLVPRSQASTMDPAALETGITRGPGHGGTATVIVPVYNAFDLLPEVLARAETGADQPLRLLLIEDASSDTRVRPFLRDWATDPARRFPVQLLENPQNLGFIGSINRGFETARSWPEDPVVLLNADALLPQGWTSRLLGPLADPGIATVTPMSNDAEIFNIPTLCRRHPLPPGLGDQLDAAARDLNPRAGLVEAPTGVGFCMAIAPAFLQRLPAFDTVFGKGYGEETDWCQKARALGGRHVAAVDLFVEHRGGSSFGSDAKRRLLEQNGAVISRRYPGYDREVQDFIRDDPLATSRLALGLSWAALARPDPVPVWLAHAMGGGAENDLARRIAAEIAGPGPVVVLRVGQGHRWKLELHSAMGVTAGLTQDFALIRRLLARLPRRHILYSCGVGDRDPLALPGLLLDLAGRGKDPLPGGPQPIGVMLHDFFPVSPSYTLLGSSGRWQGLPRPGTSAGDDPAHRSERPGGIPVSLAEWQAEWGGLITAADRITAFSQNSRALVADLWPAAASRITVQPHALLAQIPRIAPAEGAGRRPVIGVLGNIGLHKGAAIVQQLSRALERDPALGIAVIGQFDPAFRLARGTPIHGSYEWRDLPGLVERYGICAWLVPSVWPETFSFTIHEAIATGMPVFAFDLGAQGDALRRALDAGAPGALLPLADRLDPALLKAHLPAFTARPCP